MQRDHAERGEHPSIQPQSGAERAARRGADEEDRRHDTAAAARERALLGDEKTEIGDALGDAHRVRGYCIVSI